MKTATLYYERRSATAPRDIADLAPGIVTVPQDIALQIAREIDEYGTLLGDPLPSAARGHGVTIKYANGRIREVRA